jgi:coenzyme F420-reducing hydrogenase delta subunit
MGLDLPKGMRVIEIPCGGIVSLDYVFAALRANADGVMIITCHEDNCNSEQGNIYAKHRVASIADMLSQMGFERDRLMLASVASNMGKTFSDMTQDFEKTIKSLGPSRLKKA